MAFRIEKCCSSLSQPLISNAVKKHINVITNELNARTCVDTPANSSRYVENAYFPNWLD